MRIKDLLNGSKIVAKGFKAVADLEKHYNSVFEDQEIVVSTLPAPKLLKQGITEYVAPRFERGQVFKTAEEIIEANIPVDAYVLTDVFKGSEVLDLKETIIVSRHEGTIEVLKDKYPNAKVYDGDVSVDDIKDHHVVGTLPPHLVAECGLYTPVTIKDFDYTVDGDIKGEELKERLEIEESYRARKIPFEKPRLETLDQIKDFFDYDYNEFLYEWVQVRYTEDMWVMFSLEYMLNNIGWEIKKSFSFTNREELWITKNEQTKEEQYLKVKLSTKYDN